MTIREEILLDIKTISELRGIQKAANSLRALNRQGVDTSAELQRIDKYNKQLGVSTRQLDRAFGRFKFELLSVMFFGMQLQRLFGQMLEPSRKLVGVHEVWTDLLSARFMPVAMAELQWVMDMNEWLDELNETTGGVSDSTIGWTMKIGEAASGIMFFGGQIGLFLIGLEKLGVSFDKLKWIGAIAFKFIAIATAAALVRTGVDYLVKPIFNLHWEIANHLNPGLKELYDLLEDIGAMPFFRAILQGLGIWMPGLGMLGRWTPPKGGETNINITTSVDTGLGAGPIRPGEFDPVGAGRAIGEAINEHITKAFRFGR